MYVTVNTFTLSRVQFQLSGAMVRSWTGALQWCDCALVPGALLQCSGGAIVRSPRRKQFHPDVTPANKLKAPLIAFASSQSKVLSYHDMKKYQDHQFVTSCSFKIPEISLQNMHHWTHVGLSLCWLSQQKMTLTLATHCVHICYPCWPSTQGRKPRW